MSDSVTSLHGEDLDPAIRRFIQTTGAEFRRHAGDGAPSPVEIRRICELVRAPWRQGGPAMRRTTEVFAPTRHGEVRLRVYDPSETAGKPALVYLHGGGWTMFSLDTHDRLMREYAARADVVVVGVDYALSPEAKFPVALEQSIDAVRWLAKAGRELGVDPGRIAIGGDSAGGNLSVGVALVLRDEGDGDLLKGMLLNYTAFDDVCSEADHARFGGPEYMLTSDEVEYFWNNYVASADDRNSPLARSITADVRGLPPAFLTIPECDVLSSQSYAMSDRLRAAGVPVRAEVYRGASHSFLEAVSISELADRALQDGSEWLRQTLNAG
ncbi:alpha/beta hydrolase [Phenylobacterium hankyongense]|uniref:Alpha/beta hydrolase n=1 Tax=Phenylobacterium hankyongense TaxID=1813876 RepID=A0A328AYK4_9CAUL|nr:alpha/beta hydrolase fold domain-containing protein [Phenylobacterium hankyongense]RAK60212.1 alpha/beta hydrolase [Phenylobacterium hankyongense]